MPTDTRTRPAADPFAEVGLVHYVCCVDDERAFCGNDSPGDLTTEPASCVVCIDLAAGGCPFGHSCDPVEVPR